MERSASEGNEDSSRVLIPGQLHSQIHEIFLEWERQVQRHATRHALDRAPDGGVVRMNRVDLLQAIRTVVPSVLADLERELVDQQHDAHVRRAS
jgi:hypothetical protein